MYLMNRNNQIGLTSRDPLSEAIQMCIKAKRILEDSTQGLEFDPEKHLYTFCGTKLDCVSDIVKEFAPFDLQGKATSASKNPKHELYGHSPEEIIEIWSNRGKTAADAGTAVHEFAEACYLVKAGREEEIKEPFSSRLRNEGLMAENPKEIAAAKWWDNLDLERFVLVAKETKIVNPELKYAGTMDLLLYDLANKYYVLKDYKTNADLFRWFGDKLRPPLSMIKADDHGKYTLQQNLYRIQLENIGIHVGEMSLIWLKDDSTYQEVTVENTYEKLIRFAMAERVATTKNKE